MLSLTLSQDTNMKKLPSLNDLISLKGKHALITGAAAGIGKAIALRFSGAGATLSLVDINSDKLAVTESELASLGAHVSSHVADLSDKKAIDELWDSLSGREPDILVNNAGIYPFEPFLEVEEPLYRRVMATNLDSVFWMCQQMIAKRKKQGGVIVNIGSIEAMVAFKEELAHYSISKAGVTALTRALAKEHAKHGFRVNAILPGGIITPGTKKVAKKVLKLKLDLIMTGVEFMQRLPAGRMGQPDEVARMALVLASDLASYMHGAAIPVDGGFLSA
jgi:NAD(P)-dependent dehydrogenase (short-subunit alcohol dehydrogenase family)